ncbi:MAG: helicase, partial [Planctomycetaceae bacterium]
LKSDNYQATKDRLQKAVEFCRKNGYSVPSKVEREMFRQLQADYEHVLRRESEKEQQQRIREQMREEARVAREIQKELERVERERRMIEQAIADAVRKAGAEHSSEIEALRHKLAEAEERGRRTQAQAELTKAGHVYVISNIGAFGENIYKVGMTRRFIP